MRRGWRNDPAWIEHYRRRDAERFARELDRVRLGHEIARNSLLQRLHDAARETSSPAAAAASPAP